MKLLAIAALLITLCSCHRSTAPLTPADRMATAVLDVAQEALKRDDGGPMWIEMENRLGKLYGDASPDADEAVVILMSFYLGEHNGEELIENVLSRGPRMVPLLERYAKEEPAGLLDRYPEYLHLERSTTTGFIRDSIRDLNIKASIHGSPAISFEPAPARHQQANCTPKLITHPAFKMSEKLLLPGERYNGSPILGFDIDESGRTANIHAIRSSGSPHLDTVLISQIQQWKYLPRPGCGVLQSTIDVTIDWY